MLYDYWSEVIATCLLDRLTNKQIVDILEELPEEIMNVIDKGSKVKVKVKVKQRQ